MERPTIRQEVTCPSSMYETDECPEFLKTGRCWQNKEHLYFPRSDYKTRLEKDFRDLPDCVVLCCVGIHRLRHLAIDKGIEPLPEKPSIDEMREAVRRYRLAESALTQDDIIKRC